jgi:FkbH-like protein
MAFDEIAKALEARSKAAWGLLRQEAGTVETFADALKLVTLRKRAVARAVPEDVAPQTLRVALVGASTLSPLRELLELFLWAEGFAAETFIGAFDNYVAEILDAESELHAHRPDVTIVVPSEIRCRFDGPLDAPIEEQRRQVEATATAILDLCRAAHERTGGDVVVTNFVLPAHRDMGGFRTRSLASDYTFRKAVNLELGLRAPASMLLCDLEFLGARLGGRGARDPRHWFESKQMFSLDFAVAAARELATTIRVSRRSPKKVLVLDLDNTLWGGVIGDDGVEGIELGDTSPRGEAFKAFQTYIRSLKMRGVLLAVCSKNDYARAVEPFQRHPEMVLKLDDFVSFKANWDPKSDNIREMATELALGADSFVFVDDNPAEVEIVRQFVPQVATIALGPDPATYVGVLADSGHFEPRAITAEDKLRSEQYRTEAERQAFRATVTDMASYLASLEMAARVLPFRAEDVPRIAQLVNKSNQFNLTTRRRSEAEVSSLLGSPKHACFTIRLADRFGDHGLIAVVIGEVGTQVLDIDTWLMSCRVLKREVEELTVNEIVRQAEAHGVTTVRGTYIATPKNGMVRDLYVRMGFAVVTEAAGRTEFARAVADHRPLPTKIAAAYE